MNKNPNYQKEYQKKYSQSKNGILIRNKANNKYQNTEKFKETRKKYNKNNKEKISESNRKYYLKTKHKRKVKKKFHYSPRVEIVIKPIILSFE